MFVCPNNLKHRHTNSVTQMSSPLAPGIIAQRPLASPVVAASDSVSSSNPAPKPFQGSVSCVYLILGVLVLIRCRSSMHHPDLPLNLPPLLFLLPPPPPKIRSQDPRLYSDLAGPYVSSSDNVLAAGLNIKCIGTTENTRYVVAFERSCPFTVAFWGSRPLRKHYSVMVAQAKLDPLRAMLTPSPSSGSHTTACTTNIPLSSTIIGKGGVRSAIRRLGLRE